ncbi:MAG: hypothetical protein RQ867_06775 [Mariprofundaceae bacterium]|nr:hypothetical protein [Mariprofundaceae bacterium]
MVWVVPIGIFLLGTFLIVRLVSNPQAKFARKAEESGWESYTVKDEIGFRHTALRKGPYLAMVNTDGTEVSLVEPYESGPHPDIATLDALIENGDETVKTDG